MRLKRLSEQVVVITGASSGIGLATAKLAARRGARVVMAARSVEGLLEAAESIRREGGVVTHMVSDVSDEDRVRAIAEHAALMFGGVDTWINNAAVSIYGRAEEIGIEDMRRLFEVNFWGVVYGSRVALPYLKRNGGALINVGSIESDFALPLNGIYSAAKHAVKGFTDSLRLELEKDGAPVSVTLVKPASIDTPLFEHAKNYMGQDPKPPAPVYSAEVVARTILDCAEKPVREVFVGGAGRFQVGLSRVFPRISDKVLRTFFFRAQQRPPRLEQRSPDGALYAPHGSYGRARGDHRGHVMRSSAYTFVTMHPAKATLLALWATAAAVGVSRLFKSA